MMNEFEMTIQNLLDHLPVGLLSYDEINYFSFDRYFQPILQYAYAKHLQNTILSLYIVRGMLMAKMGTDLFERKKHKASMGVHFAHCLNITQLLINLHPNLYPDQEDYVLAAALSHVIPEVFDLKGKNSEVFTSFGFDQEVYKLIQINYRNLSWNDEQKQSYYDSILENKLALLIKIVDRANILEQLYEAPLNKEQEYIRDTKQYFLPMCVKGKELYPELYPVFTVIHEKMRCLIDITDIITNKHIDTMNELNNQILELIEDNARIRKMIQEIKRTKKAS